MRPTTDTKVQTISSPNIETILSESEQEKLYAFIYFTNIDSSCTSASTIPEQITYTLRLQENGVFNYRAEKRLVDKFDILWKNSPEYYCQNIQNTANYTGQFLGLQYLIDLAIIEYSTTIPMNDLSNTLGCIVEDREQKLKEYLRLFGLNTIINNFIWFTRTLLINIYLCILCTIFTVAIRLPSNHDEENSVSTAVFNTTHWTVILTMFFV
ncbi:unnamed protein product [Didymodactylos carnosus]|uniref:Uncharacterized protein n=1 Tax=Didymodactylos carnosus TaxID=1234261 RepID=A0A8S2FEQ1_9BILA|nr:unnamed protein product [Didymodactylos carnosus]CAF4240981.1 unnamed protein product [Didymodactylos carnosus]